MANFLVGVTDGLISRPLLQRCRKVIEGAWGRESAKIDMGSRTGWDEVAQDTGRAMKDI